LSDEGGDKKRTLAEADFTEGHKKGGSLKWGKFFKHDQLSGKGGGGSSLLMIYLPQEETARRIHIKGGAREGSPKGGGKHTKEYSGT